MNRRQAIIMFLLTVALVILIARETSSSLRTANNQTTTIPPPTLSDNLFLAVPGGLQEAGSITESTNSVWWLSSGGYFCVASSGVASTIIGSLPINDPWRVLYNKNNSIDTDNGYHPQNIFRLVSRSQWQNYEEQAYFLIKNNDLSASPNRNASNGLLLFDRYQNGNNLYYAGIRVDGAAVIKKKINGIYYTMAYQPIFPGTYDHTKEPNLLPLNEWIGLRTVIITNATSSVTVSLYADIGRTGNWKKILSATDDGKQYGGAPILAPGYVGIRTDFMDVEFNNFQITEK